MRFAEGAANARAHCTPGAQNAHESHLMLLPVFQACRFVSSVVAVTVAVEDRRRRGQEAMSMSKGAGKDIHAQKGRSSKWQ